MDRPEVVTEEVLTYLDDLRESGETNMYGARPFLQEEFCFTHKEASDALTYWMRTFTERHPCE